MAEQKSRKDWAVFIERSIKDFINTSPVNSFPDRQEKIWAEPLVGFSKGNDPLYKEFKNHIGPFYWTPLEIFTLAFPERKVAEEDLTVISWILPQTDVTKSDNRREKQYPSERWAKGRSYGEQVNNKLRQHVVELLKEAGIAAVAPLLSPLFARKESERCGIASTWSERHTAYAAGLGTFGLCDGLITPKGKAVRVGSVVAQVRIPRTERPYQDRHAYCLFFTKGACTACMKRCPVGAITEAGHDKGKCYNYTRNVVQEYVYARYGIKDFPCGLCQTGVPCESQIPKGKEENR